MTTIGYGDIVARGTLSRIILFLTIFYGALIFPILVVTITNIFEIKNNEGNAIKIVKMLIKKSEI